MPPFLFWAGSSGGQRRVCAVPTIPTACYKRWARFALPTLRAVSEYDLEGWERTISNTAQKKFQRNHADRLAKSAVSPTIANEPPSKGYILAALRRSPLVGANLDFTRSRETKRKSRAQ